MLKEMSFDDKEIETGVSDLLLINQKHRNLINVFKMKSDDSQGSMTPLIYF